MLKQVLLVVFCFIIGANNAHSIDLSDIPLDVRPQSAQPLLMLILDNSASMNAEYLTPETDGLFEHYSCLFAPQVPLTGQAASGEGEGEGGLPKGERRLWKSQWHGYNSIFYAPQTTYLPWDNGFDMTFEQADVHRPCFDPVKCSQNSNRITFSQPFLHVSVDGKTYAIANAHYFTVYDTNHNGNPDLGEPVYLVTWPDADKDNILDCSKQPEDDRRLFFRYKDDGDDLVEDNELTLVENQDEKKRIMPVITNDRGEFERYKTDFEDLQNFANWFSYYRTRGLCLKAAVGSALSSLKGCMQVGLYAVNDQPRISVTAQDAWTSSTADHLRSAVYQMKFTGDSTLHSALDTVGRYYHQGRSSLLGPSPLAHEEQGGGCQPVHALIITDGYDHQASVSDIGNADGNNGSPFADSWANTLADVAMYYYENDLSPRLPDAHPGHGCDKARHQHLITHVIAFGPPGSMDAPDRDGDGQIDMPSWGGNSCVENSSASDPAWPSPLQGIPSVMDDLWHAAVNGHGQYRYTRKPMILDRTLKKVLGKIHRVSQVCSDIMFSGSALDQTASVIVHSSYNSGDWSGDLSAYHFDAAKNASQGARGDLLWRSAENLDSRKVSADTRRIVSYGGYWQDPVGIPFRYNSMSDAQRVALGSDLVRDSILDRTAREKVDFLRGTEMISLRKRSTLLGDVVHASPVIYGKTVFVGANDGMVHAFSMDEGRERFAYLPNLVFRHLANLSRYDYPDNHRFFVDGGLYAGEVITGKFQRMACLVGGLGKGGKGYYCLKLNERQRTGTGDDTGDYTNTFTIDEIDGNSSEQEISRIVMWEYPRPQPDDDGMDNNGNGLVDEPDENDPDIGFGYSRAYVVNANIGKDSYRPVVIFGNGYGSENQKAVLYILDAQRGTLLRKIDTGVAGENGLSSPALIDVDLDRCVDYAYAGDLKGNLWKFDLTAKNPGQWGLAYGHDLNANRVIDAADGDLAVPVFETSTQSITTRPNIMRMHARCGPQLPGFMVIFGTGRYLGASDRVQSHTDALYGIWDFGDDDDDSEIVGRLLDESNGRLSTRLVLVRQQVLEEITGEDGAFRRLSELQPEYATVDDMDDNDGNPHNNRKEQQDGNPRHVVGWYLDLPADTQSGESSVERIIQDIELRAGLVISTSFIPSPAPCSHGGTSWLYFLDACNGISPMDEKDDAILPWRLPAAVRSNLLIVKSDPKSPKDVLFLLGHQGHVYRKEFPGEKWGKRFWWENFLSVRP